VCVWLIGRSFTQLIGDLNELRYKDYGDEARGAHRSVLYTPTQYTSAQAGRHDSSRSADKVPECSRELPRSAYEKVQYKLRRNLDKLTRTTLLS